MLGVTHGPVSSSVMFVKSQPPSNMSPIRLLFRNWRPPHGQLINARQQNAVVSRPLEIPVIVAKIEAVRNWDTVDPNYPISNEG
jgi:hypothetical protein